MKKEENTLNFNLAVKKKRFIRELEQLKAIGMFEVDQERTDSSRERTEIADAATEFERQLALGFQRKGNLEMIERALNKIDNGSYGICDDCGKLIDSARMEILPYSNQCIECCRISRTTEREARN
jgi:RNA polymerase-binding transcription factor DksA